MPWLELTINDLKCSKPKLEIGSQQVNAILHTCGCRWRFSSQCFFASDLVLQRNTKLKESAIKNLQESAQLSGMTKHKDIYIPEQNLVSSDAQRNKAGSWGSERRKSFAFEFPKSRLEATRLMISRTNTCVVNITSNVIAFVNKGFSVDSSQTRLSVARKINPSEWLMKEDFGGDIPDAYLRLSHN